MTTIVECHAEAARKLRQADSTPHRRANFEASADRWTLLAARLAAMDAADINLCAALLDAIPGHVVRSDQRQA